MQNNFQNQPYFILRLCKWSGFTLLFLFSFTVFAFIPFVDNGNLMLHNKPEISIHGQYILKKQLNDFNILVQADKSILSQRGKKLFSQKDIYIRYLLSYGYSGFLLGSFLKFIPFPDYYYQPAVGISTGATYNIFSKDSHYISVHLRPFMSKKIETQKGGITSYIALPMSMRVKNFTAVHFPVRVSLGFRIELSFIHFHQIELNIEWSKELTKNTTDFTYPYYFSVGLITH